MKFLIQFLQAPFGGKGVWSNTSWEGDDKEKVIKKAKELAMIEKIAAEKKVERIRVVETIFEADCKGE
jgi:hypothetical protein